MNGYINIVSEVLWVFCFYSWICEGHHKKISEYDVAYQIVGISAMNDIKKLNNKLDNLDDIARDIEIGSVQGLSEKNQKENIEKINNIVIDIMIGFLNKN